MATQTISSLPTFSNEANLYQIYSGQGQTGQVDLENQNFLDTQYNAGEKVNAVGLNTADMYAYGIATASHELVRIGGDGQVEPLGLVDGLPTDQGTYYVGDFGGDGLLYVRAGSKKDVLYGINVETQAVEETITLSQNLNNVYDIAYSTVDDKFYASQKAKENKLLSIDMDGTVSEIGGNGIANLTFGAMYADADGNIYGGANQTGGLYQFDTTTGTATRVGQGPISNTNDGFSNPTLILELPPLANEDEAITNEDVAVTIDVLVNDSAGSGEILTIDSVEDPANGSAQIVDSKIVFTPDPGFSGIETFNYTIINDQAQVSTAEVAVTVIPKPACGVFTVGESGEVTFDYLFDGGWWQGELAIYNLDEMDTYELGSEAYIQEAANRALSGSSQGHVLMSDATEGAKFSTALPWESDFNSGIYEGIKTFTMTPGSQFGIMMVQHNTVQALADDPSIHTEAGNMPIFSIAEANPGAASEDFSQLSFFNDDGTYGIEATRVDLGQSDRDYNDIVFQLQGVEHSECTPYYGDVRNPARNFRLSDVGESVQDYTTRGSFDDGYLTVGTSGEVWVDFLFDGGWYQGEVGLFSLDGLDEYNSESTDFLQEVASRALSNSTQGYVLVQDTQEGVRFDANFDWENYFNNHEYQGPRQLELTPGEKYGVMLVPNGTLDEVLTNPTLNGQNGKRPYFSMPDANILNAIQMVENESNGGVVLGMEDLNINFGGDRDYNDIILRFEGIDAIMPDLEQEANIEREWRTTALGGEILAATIEVF